MVEPKKVRVLLVDDEKHVRMLVRAILMPLDCEVVGEAENGSEALVLYRELRPDAVMLDINMPVMDGKEALAGIMALDRNAVVIMLTSLSDIDTVKDTIALGAANYIRKDAAPQEMRDLIRKTWQEHLPREGRAID